MADPYREVLQALVGLGAERVLVLQGPQPLQPKLIHGFQGQWQDHIDLGQLQERPVSDERSICVPFWSPSSRILGFLYADTRKAFSRETVTAVQRCARKLEQALYGAAPPPASSPGQPRDTPGRKLGLRPARPTPAPVKLRRTQAERPVLLRSLATMLAAGLPIDRALHGLSRQHPVCAELCAKVCAGGPLSKAMSESGEFAPFESALVEVGEHSGCLDKVLAQLAEISEKQARARLRLHSALAYPLLLSALSLAALLLAPPLVLRGQLELLPHPPLLTRLLMSGVAGPLILALLGLATLSLRKRYQRWPLWRSWAGARFAQALAITYRVGVPFTKGLELAARASQLPDWQEELPLARQALAEGRPISQVLSCFRSLPGCFRPLVAAGEEGGKLDATLDWVARFLESEFENRLDSLLNLLQPLLILVMGVWTGLLLLATLLPMVELVQNL